MKSDFKDKNIYVGMDVHKSSCEIKVMTEGLSMGNVVRLSPLSAQKIYNFLTKNYKNGNYHCVYEAGFSGFWLQRELESLGVSCIVVNPADVPTSHKEKTNKSDKIDCIKLARALRSDSLNGIYILTNIQEGDRALTRQKSQVSKSLSRLRNQIKSHLNYRGIQIDFKGIPTTTWSYRFVEKIFNHADSHDDYGLMGLVETMKVLRQQKLIATQRIRTLSRQVRHEQLVNRLMSIKGIGRLSAMVIITEVVEIKRFKTFDKFQSYVGFIPGQRSSGDDDRKGSMTTRANKYLRRTLIQCAWSAVRYDPEMAAYYLDQKTRLRRAQLAIVKVSRKLLRRIKYEWEQTLVEVD